MSRKTNKVKSVKFLARLWKTLSAKEKRAYDDSEFLSGYNKFIQIHRSAKKQ